MARLVGGPEPAVGVDPYRHEARRLDPGRRRKLVPPHRKQPTYHPMASGYLGNVGAFLEALRDNPGFLFGRPQSAPALPGDHLDTTIRVAFMPGIKHGICHRSPPTISSCHVVSQANLAMARWVPLTGYGFSAVSTLLIPQTGSLHSLPLVQTFVPLLVASYSPNRRISLPSRVIGKGRDRQRG